MLKHAGDALEQRQIDVLPLEDIVNVLSVAVQPAGKLAHSHARLLEIGLYCFACVYFHICLTICSPNTIQKESGALIRQSPLGRAGLPVSKILKNKPHLFVFGNKYSQASLISDIRTNISEWSRFTESDKRKLAFFSIKNRCPAFRQNNGAKIQKISVSHGNIKSFACGEISMSHRNHRNHRKIRPRLMAGEAFRESSLSTSYQ